MENFKAPSSLTKAQACYDLGVTGNDAKFMAKDVAIKKWEEAFAEEKAPEVAEQKWRKESFDGGKGEIISIAYASTDDEVINGLHRKLSESEADMLDKSFAMIRATLSTRNWLSDPVFIGHNISFDLKFLYRRAIILGVDPGFNLPFRGRHGSDYFDNMQEWCEFKETISQDNLAKVLGLPGKPDNIDGSKVWDFVKAGKENEVFKYNCSDVETVIAVHKRLTQFKG